MVTLAKKKYGADRFETLFNEHKSVLFVDTTNINNALLQQIKFKVLDAVQGVFMNGKKRTFAKRCLAMAEKNPALGELAEKICGNTMLFFTNESCLNVAKVIATFSRQGNAKYNQPALLNYHIEPQLTNLPPEKTKVFQKLRVPTKLTKGSIEITAGFQVLEKNRPVTQMQMDILSIMNILPYTYRPILRAVFTNGELADPAIYEIETQAFATSLTDSIKATNCIALGASFPLPSVVQMNMNQLIKDTLALAVTVSDKFESPAEFAEKIALLNDPEAMAKMQQAACSAAASTAQSTDASKSDAGKDKAQAAEESESEAAESMEFDF
ncbi:MAG: 60S acidic ribosomal protein P0 [Marteilia pararefringens]